MHLAQLRQVDLNLLVVFAVLVKERHVSRAAVRLGMSQPAVSRALQRTREMFQDDLLVRTKGIFRPTPFGQRLLGELETMLPRLDCLLRGKEFDPTCETIRFRITASDYAALLICGPLCRDYSPEASKVCFEVLPKGDQVFQALERGQVDLVLGVDDGSTVENLHSEFLFEEEFVCVVAKDQPFTKQLTLKQYLGLRHVTVTGGQSRVERDLAHTGVRRECHLAVPYFTAAVRAVADTNFVATVGRRLAERLASGPELKVLKAPKEFLPYRYLMFWHARMDTDASHAWLRAAVRDIGRKLCGN